MRSVRNMVAMLVLSAAMLAAGSAWGADAKEKEQQLIKVLESNAPAADKAIPCKQLAVYGSKDAVPALAALLPDKELSSWARIALEAIPDPAADDALREALNKVQGRLVIGVINSIGVRRDGKSVEALAAKLKEGDAEVATAAAAALGHIGGEAAAKVLEPALASAPEEVRSGVAEGCIYAAEQFLGAGNKEEAARLYDAVRKADVPKQRLVEATRGAILARGTAGIPLLVEQLRSSGAFFSIGLRVARELPGAEVTDALLAELGKPTPDREALLLYALGDRGDERALPAILNAAKSSSSTVRVAASAVLEKLGNASCIPVLLDLAAGEDADAAKAAKATLARLRGKEIDDDLFKRLEGSSGNLRRVLVQLAEERKIPGAVALFVKYAEDGDAGVRTAALDALGGLGDEKQAPGLVALLQKTKEADDRTAIEKALMAICGRTTGACMPHLTPLLQSDVPADRIVALHALAVCGGGEALDRVKLALNDADEGVQTEAVRTLSNWPNRWPEDVTATAPLLELAKSAKKPQHQVLALRGYIQFVHGARRLSAADRLSKLNEVLPLITRPEEKRGAIAALGAIGAAGSVEPLVKLTDDPQVSDEACSAILGLLARNPQGLTKEQRKAALQAVIDKTKNESMKTRAQGMLNATK